MSAQALEQARDRERAQADTIPPPSHVRVPLARTYARSPADRPVVALVSGDRFARAFVARSLVSAGCNVQPYDDASEFLRVFGGERDLTQIRIDAVVIDRLAPDADDALAALEVACPYAAVLAPGATVRSVLVALGIDKR